MVCYNGTLLTLLEFCLDQPLDIGQRRLCDPAGGRRKGAIPKSISWSLGTGGRLRPASGFPLPRISAVVRLVPDDRRSEGTPKSVDRYLAVEWGDQDRHGCRRKVVSAARR